MSHHRSGDKIFQPPQAGDDIGYGTLSKFTGQVTAGVRGITWPWAARFPMVASSETLVMVLGPPG